MMRFPMPSIKLSTVLVILGLVQFAPVFIHAQQAEECSDDGVATCAASNQTCVVIGVENNREVCRNCPPGMVRWKNQTCLSVDQLDIDDYIQAYDPLFVDELVNLTQRLQYLRRTAQLVAEINSADKPFTLQLNEFSAESFEERRQRNGFRHREGEAAGIEPAAFVASSDDEDALPAAVDWVKAGAVTVVKHQWICGCCWSVAAAGAIEGKAAIDAHNLTATSTSSAVEPQVSYSFQQMISCNDANSGCNGGSVIRALQYAHTNDFGGLTTWVDYPFEDRRGETTEECKLSGKQPAIQSAEARSVVDMDDRRSGFSERLENMKKGLLEQPVAVVLRATCDLLSNYKGGILTEDGDCACDKPSCIDHAVLLVGYNDTHDPPYLLIKNSWGRGWGEGGYFRIAQKDAGQFGLFGILAEGVFPSSNTDFAEADDSLEWWKILIISLAFGVFVAAICYLLEGLWKGCRTGTSGDGQQGDNNDAEA